MAINFAAKFVTPFKLVRRQQLWLIQSKRVRLTLRKIIQRAEPISIKSFYLNGVWFWIIDFQRHVQETIYDKFEIFNFYSLGHSIVCLWFENFCRLIIAVLRWLVKPISTWNDSRMGNKADENIYENVDAIPHGAECSYKTNICIVYTFFPTFFLR